MREADSFYYNSLGREQKKAYYAIYEGLMNIETGFQVPHLTGKELSDIFFLLRLDHPEIFYAVSFRYKWYADSQSVIFEPEYLFPKGKILEHKKALEARIRKLVRGADGLDEKGKELYVHDFILQNVNYDKLKKPYSHEIIGALGHGTAVCEGISKAVKILCGELGIWCIIAISEAAPERGIKYRHAWNIVKIGGQYYHLDATFDNTLSRPDLPRYDYVNLCDKQIGRDHEPVIYPVPPCTEGGKNWYQEKKLAFTKMEDVRKRAAQAVKKGKIFLFQWRGGYMNREILEDLLTIFREEAVKKNKYPAVSVNVKQGVLQVRFLEEVQEAGVTEEEANEGEQE